MRGAVKGVQGYDPLRVGSMWDYTMSWRLCVREGGSICCCGLIDITIQADSDPMIVGACCSQVLIFEALQFRCQGFKEVFPEGPGPLKC